MLRAGDGRPPGVSEADMANLLGKRYVCGVCEATVLVTKAGDGELVCHDQPMEVAQAKPLPSSD